MDTKSLFRSTVDLSEPLSLGTLDSTDFASSSQQWAGHLSQDAPPSPNTRFTAFLFPKRSVGQPQATALGMNAATNGASGAASGQTHPQGNAGGPVRKEGSTNPGLGNELYLSSLSV